MQAVRDINSGDIIDFSFLMANPVIKQVFERKKEDLKGNLQLKKLLEKFTPGLFDLFVQVVEAGEPLTQELDYENDNIQKWYHLIAVKLGDGISLTMRDITQRKLLELELTRQARIDNLTNIANHCRFDEYLLQEWQRYKREQKPLSLILCDIDYFELYNNIYGHKMGDECLIKVAQVITHAAKRAIDLVARYRGEQFAVILPNTDANGALHVTQLICSEIEKLKIPHAQSQVSEYVTLSLVVANMLPTENVLQEALIIAAQKALERVKQKRSIISGSVN